MCHPWLAAGTTCVVAVLLVRELVPLVQEPAASTSLVESGLLGTRLRLWFRKRIAPVAEFLLQVGLSANGVTISQLLASLVCCFAYAHGWMFTAGWILIASGTLDVVDGEMARRHGDAGPRGAFIDSVVDRYGESTVFAGLAVFYRDSWVLWAVLVAWAGAFLVSYTRARAESLGVECRTGILQRPERYVVLGMASMASAIVAHLRCAPDGRHGVVAFGVCILALLANFTALQRIRAALGKLA
jgi:phosphatidylglycerophosphate synthase